KSRMISHGLQTHPAKLAMNVSSDFMGEKVRRRMRSVAASVKLRLHGSPENPLLSTGEPHPHAVALTHSNRPHYSSIVIVRRISSVLNPSALGVRTPGRATTS